MRWVEQRSRTTHENALRSAEILHARAEFAAAGIEGFPAPTGIPSSDYDTLPDYLPSMAGLRTSYYAIYEICANLVLWLSRAG